MKNFTFQNTTKLIFGKGQIAKLSKELPKGKRILVTLGGGSVKKNGVYDQVKAALEGFDFIEFWGIEPNPKVVTLRIAVKVCKEEKIDFILAGGGGSGLDGTILIAAAAMIEADACDLVLNPSLQNGTLPFASVMTLPATGSEMNKGAVISNNATGEKYGYYNTYPVFSILAPESTFSLPAFQVSCGIADTFVHVIEQYLTIADCSPLMARWAEGILQTLIEIAPKIRENQCDYDAMANFMICATMGLNGFVAMGVPQDWATHMIGHEITALTGTTHGQTLVLVIPRLMKVMREQKADKIVQFGERVFGIVEGTKDERIDNTIAATKAFFKSLNLATEFEELSIGSDVLDEIVRRFKQRGTLLGENSNIDYAVVEKILKG